ncbi:hypothetical protein [Bryobacter aggregatus]|uniref:hypothetical protein n=1 Tax=Bryobacter aggregatus TaxID=360054 RepID=UPI0004E0F32E|nr:hypothetical protein [Bryobacter aggregatus]
MSHWQPSSQPSPTESGSDSQNTALMENFVQTPTYFVWEVAGKPVTIHLDFEVVDKLAMEVMRGFGAVPRRGAEVGGILMGSIEMGDKLLVRVEDFIPVPCDYMRGPSYLLTENDEARFRATVETVKQSSEKRLYAVGFYRSHTRDGLALSDEDLQIFEKYFADPTNVILLIRPFATKPSVGGFFFEENGGFHRESSYLEFPFKRRDLGGGASPSMRTAPAEERTEPRGPESAEQTPGEGLSNPGNPDDLRDWIQNRRSQADSSDREATTSARFRSKSVWIPLSFVFLLLGVIIGFQAALVLNRGDAQKIAAQSLSLSLTAQLESGKLIVRWDRNSAAVLNAKSGTLQILDGSFTKTVNLDGRQLQNGSVIYMTADSKVSFRLEVVTNNKGTISETVEYLPPSR